MFNQIKIYCSISGFHWDNVHGAGIEGVAAASIWDAYVAPKSQIAMCPFCNKAWPLYNDMQAILGKNSGACGHHSFHPATAAPTSIAVDDILDGPDGALDLLNMDVGGSVSGTAPGGSQLSMSSAAKIAAKITPAAAVMNMQGSINCLTDAIERNMAPLPNPSAPLPAPLPAPAIPTMISHGLAMMRSLDGDLLVDQRASLLQIFSCAGGDNNLAVYVGLNSDDDFDVHHAFISQLLDESM
ncbi:hypothetical protein BDR06DRAFT_1011660 [Suillus hirtellus]|nr:hypothetical protein BDR06DRAFT_1011660 [Suillus hirtellus]